MNGHVAFIVRFLRFVAFFRVFFLRITATRGFPFLSKSEDQCEEQYDPGADQE